MKHIKVDPVVERPRLGGRFKVVVHNDDGTETVAYAKNLIVDVGIKHLGAILDGTETTNLDLARLEPGSGTTPPVVGDTDTETPITVADRLPVTTQSTASTSPFEIEIAVFIDSLKYTRPFTITELCVFFLPDETGDLFARGLLDNPVTIAGSATATLTYGIIFR